MRSAQPGPPVLRMAPDKNTVPVRFICFLLFFHVSLGQPSSSRFEVSRSPLRGIIRSRRQVCEDGTYESDSGRSCCQCAAGQYLTAHCNSTHERKCEYCNSGTYNSHPNSFGSCQPCTSCSQPNANLEVAELCTIARDTTCRCKKNHYCSSNMGSCEICHPCTECSSTSIKEACTATKDAVCHEPKGSYTREVVGSVVGVVLVVLAVAGAVFYYRKRQAARKRQSSVGNTPHGKSDDTLQPLNVPDVDIQPLLPQIAVQLSWKDMEHLAMQVGIAQTAIEACQLDHQGDSQEQTLQLLRKWVESQGKSSSKKLVKMLSDNGKINKAEKILDILNSEKSCEMNI